VVDEFLFSFTHTCHMDWMIPGIQPTGKRVSVPFVVVVKFEGDKLLAERIYWLVMCSTRLTASVTDEEPCMWWLGPYASQWTSYVLRAVTDD